MTDEVKSEDNHRKGYNLALINILKLIDKRIHAARFNSQEYKIYGMKQLREDIEKMKK